MLVRGPLLMRTVLFSDQDFWRALYSCTRHHHCQVRAGVCDQRVIHSLHPGHNQPIVATQRWLALEAHAATQASHLPHQPGSSLEITIKSSVARRRIHG